MALSEGSHHGEGHATLTRFFDRPRRFDTVQKDIPLDEIKGIRKGEHIGFTFLGKKIEEGRQGQVTALYRKAVLRSPFLTKLFGKEIIEVDGQPLNASDVLLYDQTRYGDIY